MTFALAGAGAGPIGTQRAAAPHRPEDLKSGAHSIGADLFGAQLDTAVATTGASDGPRRVESSSPRNVGTYEEEPSARETENDAAAEGAAASTPVGQDVDEAPTAGAAFLNLQQNPNGVDDAAIAASMPEEDGGDDAAIGEVDLDPNSDPTAASQPTAVRGEAARATARSSKKADVKSDPAEIRLEDATAVIAPEPEGAESITEPDGAAPTQPAILSNITNTTTPAARAAQDAALSEGGDSLAADAAIDGPLPGAEGDAESHADAQSSAQHHAEAEVELAGPERAAADAASETRTTVQHSGGLTRAVAERLEVEQAASAESPTQTLAPDTTDRLVKSMRLQYMRGGGDALVQLRPEHLGPVTISLRVEDGNVSARIAAENATVAEWLQANETTLREALKANGLHLDRLIVDRDGQSPHHQSQRDQAPRRHARPRLTERESTFEVRA